MTRSSTSKLPAAAMAGPIAAYQISMAPPVNTIPVSSSSRSRLGPDRRRTGNEMRPQRATG